MPAKANRGQPHRGSLNQTFAAADLAGPFAKVGDGNDAALLRAGVIAERQKEAVEAVDVGYRSPLLGWRGPESSVPIMS